MKYSGFQWIGDVPASWAIMKVKNIFTIIGGNGFPDELQGNDIGEIPFCKVSDINGTEMFVDQAQNFISMDIQKQYKFNIIPLNSIIFAKIGEALKKNHRKINSVICCIDNNTQALSILDKNRVDFKFSYYLFKIIDMKEFNNEGTIPSINNTKLKNFFVPVPSYFEQIEISSLLDKKCSKIDGIINDLEKQIEILEKYKKSVITEAVTKGLNANDELKDSGVNYIGKINKNFSTIKLKYLLEVKDGTHDTPEYVEPSDDTVPLITSKHIDYENKNILYDEANHISHVDYVSINKRSNVELYDIIMPMIGTIGNPIIVFERRPFSIKNVALLKTRKNLVFSQFINYQLYSYIIEKQFEFQTRGGVQSFISLSVINNLCIIKTDEEIQKEIVDYLNEKCSEIDLIKSSKKEQLEVIKKYKNSLIYEYVTGKKRVGQGDANE